MVHQIKPGEPTSKISEDYISWTTGNISPLSENRLILVARWQRRLVDLAQLYTSCVHWLTTVLDKTPSQPWSHTHHIFWSNTPPYFTYTSFILHKGFNFPYDSYLFVACMMLDDIHIFFQPISPCPTAHRARRLVRWSSSSSAASHRSSQRPSSAWPLQRRSAPGRNRITMLLWWRG